MYCCPNCFSDNFLKRHIEAESSKEGKCSFCKATNAKLIKPEKLFDRFSPLFDLYYEDDKGVLINNLLQNDWEIFAFSSKAKQKKLLKAINSDLSINKNYKPILEQEQQKIEQWEVFREELKHRNRFFPENAPEKNHLEPFGSYIGIKISKNKQKFYRCRINLEEKPYELFELGKPPEKKVKNGRANPVGIPYLYLASTIKTAISEIRGHKGEKVTVAEFKIIEDLELADLRNPKNTISPFELNDDNDLELIYKNLSFLTLLGKELSKPIIPREANLEYLSSQYLCEMLKHIGFHGIIYKSSVDAGDNYVIFDDTKLKPVKIYHYQIIDVITKSDKLR